MSTINFNDSIFSQMFMEAFVEFMTPVNAFARDFTDESSAIGNAIYVPRVDGITATTGSGYENTGGTVNVITVNLSQRQVATVDISDIQASNSSAAKMQNFARQQAGALAVAVLQDIWSIFTTTNYGSAIVTTTAANWTKKQIRQLRTQLNKNKAPMANRSLLLYRDIVDSLLDDSTLATLLAYTSADSLKAGKLPPLLGFNIFETNILPLNSFSLMGVGLHPDAVAVAMRYLPTQGEQMYLDVQKVTDPDSGLTVGYRRHFNPGQGKHYASFECIYGYAVGISTGAALVTVP